MHGSDTALLTIAWALGAGLLAQVVGARWRMPAIVPLLLFGVLLGPSVTGVVRPDSLGGGLSVLVKLAVAVILFDGALTLRLGDLQRAMREVRNLVTIGVLVTWVGATLAAHLIAGLSWPVAIVFGALMTVTGPTVVQPLLKRVPLPRMVRTVLEGEAILIDPVGAVLAVAVVDIVLGIAGVQPIGILSGAWAYVGRLLIGLVVGVVGGAVLSRLLRSRLVPGELANLVALAFVWMVFAGSEAFISESGIMAVVAMGIAVQRGAVPEERRLRRFKEQLTVMGISLVFVLLAADLPLDVLRAEGWPGLLTVLTLMFVVRPINVAISLRGSSLTFREKLFVAWIGPRGIVAASVASLFALALGEAGFAEGSRLLAISFMTIALTVTLQGLSASLVSRLLGLETLAGRGTIVVGAGPLGRGIAGLVRDRGGPVVLIDRNDEWVADARREGFEVVAGNALDEQVLEDAGAEEAETLVAVTSNAEVNALAAHLGHDAFGIRRALPATADPSRGAGAQLLARVGGRMAFGHPVDVRAWEHALVAGDARFVSCVLPAVWQARPLREVAIPPDMVAAARVRRDGIEIASADQEWSGGDTVVLLTGLTQAEAEHRLDELLVRAPRATAAAQVNA